MWNQQRCELFFKTLKKNPVIENVYLSDQLMTSFHQFMASFHNGQAKP